MYILQQTSSLMKNVVRHGKPPSIDWAHQNFDKEWGKKGDNIRKGGQKHIDDETKEENK